MRGLLAGGTFLIVTALALVSAGAQNRRKPDREEGEFRIVVSGSEIGSERFVIESSGEGVTSSSTVEFKNPVEARQKVHLETRLDMDFRYVPTSYQLKSDVDGKKGAITGTFSPGQAMFDYSSTGEPLKRGLLTGKEFTVLDTNIFHHFTFLARLLKEGGADKYRKLEVIIPQETDNGFLKAIELARETISVKGKKAPCRHFRLDSGELTIDLWVDGKGLVRKVGVPSRGLEVLRVN